MIVAAGLTPAWQQIMRFDAFSPGKVNRARDVQWCSSGKVLNVAMALAHLGTSSEVVALVGGPSGMQIDREFASLGIRRRWVESHWATRTCTTILDSQGQATELVENAGPVTADELSRFSAEYAAAVASADLVILTGSLPRGVASSFFRDLMPRTPCPALLDIRGPELLEAVSSRPFLVKPNREELATTLGYGLDHDDRLQSGMLELNAKGAQWVVVTDGPRSVWVSSAGALHRIHPPVVDVVNPIGSGDCLAAGIAWGLTLGWPVLDAIRLGVAAAVENVAQLLPGRLDPQLVIQRANAISVEHV